MAGGTASRRRAGAGKVEPAERRSRASRPTGAGRPPDRETIFRCLVDAVQPVEFVRAAWEAGAVSWGRIDRWSDLDVNLVAEDGRVEEVFPLIEAALGRLAPIALAWRIPYPPDHPYQQTFYRLEGTDPCLLIDLAVFRRSSPDKFLEPQMHGPARVAFDKAGLEIPALDRDALAGRMRARVERLRRRREAFGCFIEKEIGRGNWIEAVSHYQKVLVEPLMEVLRMRHHPVHFEFGIRYVHQELPPSVLRRLVPLFFVRDEADLRRKRLRADRWLAEELEQVDPASNV